MDKILLVEDDHFFREMFSRLLTAEGYQVDTASCGRDGLSMMTSGQYSLVITDLVMPDISGLEVLLRVRESYPAVDVIMVTANANLESAIFALKHGARDYLIKPVNHDEFKHAVAQCIRQRHLLEENDELKNMLSLLRASQAIAGCIDSEHLYHLLVEAVAREAGISRALGFFMVEGALDFKVAKGISAELGRAISEEIHATLESPPEEFSIQYFSPSSSHSSEGVTSSLLIPVFNRDELYGIVVLLNNTACALPDIAGYKKNILFLIEQSLRAFDNAESFSKANDLMFIDDVSGLYNQRYLGIALEREMKRVDRYGSHLAVLFIDVDLFKQVNDIHGHLVGSRVLAEFGALIKNSLRDVDIVVRYGGDEYTAILVETPCEAAALVAERIRKNVEDHHFVGAEGKVIRLTCSIGLACCPDDTMSKNELLEMADNAMYAGKASGKNCIQRCPKAT